MAGIKQRIEALERNGAASDFDFGHCLETARRVYRSMSAEQQEARCLAKLREALSTPEPGHPLQATLWRARRRLARFYGVTA